MKQPEALRLADSLNCVTDDSCGYCQSCVIAAELRRLHALNSELLEALKSCLRKGVKWHPADHIVLSARAAIAKAEGQR